MSTTIQFTITDAQTEIAQKLCDLGTGVSLAGQSNLSVNELASWKFLQYLGYKEDNFLNNDKKLLTRKEVDSILDKK